VDNMDRQQGITKAEVEKQFFASVRPTSSLEAVSKRPEEVAAVVAFIRQHSSHGHQTVPAVRAESGVVDFAVSS